MSIEFTGVGQSNILCILDEFSLIPWAEIWCPRKSSSIMKNWHFFLLQKSFVLAGAFMTISMWLTCSATKFDQITMLSRYMWQIFPIRCLRAAFIWCWWIGGACYVYPDEGINADFGEQVLRTWVWDLKGFWSLTCQEDLTATQRACN